MGVAQDYENLRKKKEQNDAQNTEFHVAQAYNSMFGKEEETSEKIDLTSYFRERAKAKQNKSNSRENKKSSSSVKENGISLPRSEVLDRVTQARMQRKAEERAAAAKKKQEEQKAYDNMSLSEVDSRLEQLAQERAAFEKENGGALKNRFMKFATTIDPNAWDYAEKYEQNVKYLDENKAETEKLESMRLKKAQKEKLSALPQETLKLLDEYNDARYERDGRALAHSDSEALVPSNEYTDAMEDSMSRSLRIIAILEEQGYDEKTIQELAYLRKTEQEEKEAQKMIEDSKKLAEKSTAAGFVVPRLMNLPAAAIGLYDNSSQFVENKVKGIDYGVNPNSIANAFTKSNTAMDETNMEKRDWNVNVPILGKTDLYDMVYQAAASGTDSAVRAAVGGGATGAGVLMTGEVLNKGIIDGKEKGYSDEKAIAYGLTQGLIEGVTEKYSLDMILKEPKSILGGIAKGFAAEGSEEVASNWLNRAADAIVNGNNSEIKQAYKTLTEQGVPGDKALSQIIVDMIGEDAESFLIGGLSGAGMSAGYHAPRATMQKISENQLQKQLGENIIASGEAQNLAKTVSETEDFQENTRLQRNAERVLQAENNRQNAKQVGRVYQLAMEMASEADAKQQAENLDNAISQRLSELGENNAERVAPVLSKVIRGGTLTQTEAKTADTKAARQVLSEYFTPQQNEWVSKTQTKTRGQELADLLNRRQPITSEEAQRPVVAIAHTTEEGKNKQTGGTISEFAPRKLTVKAIHPTGIQFETENGQIVEDNQLIFNTDSAANFYRRATENGNVLFANLAIAAYDGSVGVDQYMTAAQRFYEAGRNGQNFSSVRKTNIVGQYLSESIAQQFYNLGENTANVEFAGIQKLYSDTDFNRAKRKGGVVKNYSQKLTGEAQAFVRFADALGKKYGIAVVVCDTIDGGNTNGFMKGNELYIALDAKGDLYTSVVGHELFHFIEHNSKPQAKKLRRLVLEQLRANENFDYEAEIARYRDLYGEQYTTEELEEELVADSMFDVFDEAFVRKIVETDRTLAEKIRDFFTEFFEFLTGRSAEFTHLSRYFDAKPYEEIRNLFESALEDASENYKGKQIDGQSIRNYTYKKSQNDKDEGVSNEYEQEYGEKTDGRYREETVVYTRDNRSLRGRGKIPEKKNYRRARERVDSFLRRTEAKGLRRKEVGTRYYAYRPAETIKENAKGLSADLSALGIAHFIYDGDLEVNHNGYTVISRRQASTLPDGSVAVNNDLTVPYKEASVHEAFHSKFLSEDKKAVQFYETVVKQIDFKNKTWIEIRNTIIQHHFPNQFDITTDYEKLYNEFAAYVCGFINNGRENEISEIFYDFDAVKEAYYELFSALHHKAGEVSESDFSEIKFSKNSKYNEYETLRMQWANSAATEAGDMAILNRKGREFVLLEATGNDTIELMKGTYKKVRSYYERTYGKTVNRIYEHTDSLKTERNRNTWDMLDAGNRRHAVRDAGQDGRKGLQTDTAGNDEHLRGRHQGTSFRKSLNDTRTVNSLVKENEKLREALELAKRELQLTKGHKMNPKHVEALARGILRKTSSRYSQKTLTENLTRIFEYIANDKEANYSVAIDAMADLSKAVLEESYVKNDSLYTQYKDMREYFRKTAIRLSETAKEEIPEYESFRKENLGRLRISEKGIELDALWGEISQQWPEFFPQDTQEAQQVYLIANALDAVQPTYENPYGYDMDEAAYDLALEMYDRYFDVAEIHTFADKKRREIQLLKAEYRQKLQEKHKEDKAAFDKSLKEVKAEYKSRMKAVTAETAKRIQQIQRAEAAKRITMRERHIETERKQMVRRQIISKTKALNNMLVNPTDQKHIPEALKKQILAFCKEMSKTGIFTRERLLDLKDRYNAIEKQANSDYESYMLYGVYDEDAADLIGKLADTIGGKRLSQLDLKELGDVRKVVEQLRFMVENENQLFATEKKETVMQAGESIIADLQKKKQRTEIAGLTKLQDYFALGCAKPVYFFKYIGGPFQELYNRVAQGEADYARTVDDAKQFFEKTAKKYDFYQWCDQKDGFKEQPKREIRFETERGESVALSVEEALSIYATGRRKQGVDHLMEGGYQLSKGNIKTQTGDKGSLIKRYIDNTVIKLTESDLLKVSESLTQQQRDFADEMVRYLSTDMAALGNTVSLRMNGLKKFNESYYFPIKSTRNFLYTTQRTHQVDNRIKHKGMTKRVTPGASNPINIAPFSDVWTDHCVDMAEYYALSLPLEDFNRVYNYKAVTDGGNEITVKEALKNIYGKKAQDYIDKLMEDINGGVTVRNTEGFSDNMIAKFKKSKVVLSFTVTLKQAASLPRAFALIDPKYLLKQNRGQSFDAAWSELKKYAPVAIIKEIGSFDTNLRTRTGDWIKEREYDRVFVKGQSAEQSLQNLATKSKALLLDSTYRDNVLTDMPGKVDQAVWIMLWNASKAEVQEKNPKLSGEELLQKAGQRFTEIIQYTQVYDSVFSRPQFLRSSSQVTKMASSFMAEPLTSLNMLADGIIRRKDGAYLTRVFASYIASAFFEVVVSSIWYAARDDDDDKTFLEKYAVSVITNFLQNLNPLNMIPFLSDVVNIFSGYDVERSDMGLVTDLYDATTGLWDEDKSAGEKLFGVLGTVGNFFGIPLENVVRDTKAFGNLIGEIGNDGGRTTTASGIWNGVLEEYEYGLSGKFITPKSEAEQYVDAMLNGDRETAEKIYQNMESGGKDESKINSAVRAVLKENEQIRKAAEARANGDIETYIQIAKSMISRGFSQDVVVGAINSAMNQLEKEKEAEAESEDVGSIESAANEAEKSEKATSFYSTQDVIKSLESGNTQSAQKAVLDIYNTKVENKVAEGKTKKEADKSARSSIKSALTSEYKARYVNGTASERSKIQKMLKSIYINGKPLYENKDFSSWLKD